MVVVGIDRLILGVVMSWWYVSPLGFCNHVRRAVVDEEHGILEHSVDAQLCDGAVRQFA